MNSRQRTTRVRPFWVAACLVTAFAFVLGFASAPASARTSGKTKVTLVSTTPAQPTAGQTFTMTFTLLKFGTPIHINKIGCYARVGGGLAKLLAQTTDGTTASCSWALPTNASGKTLDGIFAASSDTGTWYYYGFDLPVR